MSGRVWAAIMLARRVEVCESILAGRPVMCGRLDGEILRRALRGAALPPPDSFITVRPDHLDAVTEAGPIEMRRR